MSKHIRDFFVSGNKIKTLCAMCNRLIKEGHVVRRRANGRNTFMMDSTPVTCCGVQQDCVQLFGTSAGAYIEVVVITSRITNGDPCGDIRFAEIPGL